MRISTVNKVENTACSYSFHEIAHSIQLKLHESPRYVLDTSKISELLKTTNISYLSGTFDETIFDQTFSYERLEIFLRNQIVQVHIPKTCFSQFSKKVNEESDANAKHLESYQETLDKKYLLDRNEDQICTTHTDFDKKISFGGLRRILERSISKFKFMRKSRFFHKN
jgi:hypothetical protein